MSTGLRERLAKVQQTNFAEAEREIERFYFRKREVLMVLRKTDDAGGPDVAPRKQE